jgi:transposase InsO family protein
MKNHGIRNRCKRKVPLTMDRKHHLPIALDLGQRNFALTAPNQVWTGDVTSIATDEGGCTWQLSLACLVVRL